MPISCSSSDTNPPCKSGQEGTVKGSKYCLCNLPIKNWKVKKEYDSQEINYVQFNITIPLDFKWK